MKARFGQAVTVIKTDDGSKVSTKRRNLWRKDIIG